MGYLDDSLLLGDDEQECRDNVRDTTQLFQELGFMVHPKKSVLCPSKSMACLGYTEDYC